MRCLIFVCLAACGDDGLTASEQQLARDGVRSLEPEAALVETIELFSQIEAFLPSDDHPGDLAKLATESRDAALALGACATGELGADRVTYTLTGCAIGEHTASGSITSIWNVVDGAVASHAIDATIDDRTVAGTVVISLFDGARQREIHVTGIDGAWTVDACQAGLATFASDTRSFTRRDHLCEGIGTLDLSRDGLSLRVLLGEDVVVTRGERFELGGLID